MGDRAVTNYAFTKLVVDDLEGMARYYCDVFGLSQLQRVKAEIEGSPIDEIILGKEGGGGGLILLTWLDRGATPQGEVILGFTTSDIEELFTRVQAAGGSVRESPHDPSVGGPMLVGFVTDPEGHLAEVVQML
jgi:predicted enzyme related to lactoylglutathione lyase